ncbi:MAG: alpha/beta fold hydrolase [Actinomycetota bacterium]
MTSAPARSRYLTLGGHEVHLLDWGAEDAPALVMWHGLARTCRDFDTAARALADGFRVICPDTIGRGLSAWSKAPEQDYTVPAYVGHAVEMLDKLGIDRVRWVGTSMGGLVGMLAAAGPLAGRMERLVLNDIGPVLNHEAVERIRAYVGQVPAFATMAEMEAFLRFVYAPFGALSDAEWRLMAETSSRRRDDGSLTVHYDPAVMRVFAEATAAPMDLWPVYDVIACPTLCLRGATSDLLLAETADEMTRRGPKARLVTVDGCGHAPALNTPDQLAQLRAFLA